MAPPVTWAEDATAPDGSSEAAVETTADRRLLDDLYAQHRIDGRATEPDASLYFQDLGKAFGDALTSWLDRYFGRIASATTAVIAPIAYGLLLLLGFLSLLLWGRVLWRRRQASRPADPSLQRLDRPRPGSAGEGGGVAWEAQLQQALAAGQVPQAVEALWWWLAEVLGTVADGSWTSRELVLHAGRRDLMPQVRRLDRLIYGARKPSIDEVTGLWGDLRRQVSAVSGGVSEGAPVDLPPTPTSSPTLSPTSADGGGGPR